MNLIFYLWVFLWLSSSLLWRRIAGLFCTWLPLRYKRRALIFLKTKYSSLNRFLCKLPWLLTSSPLSKAANLVRPFPPAITWTMHFEHIFFLFCHLMPGFFFHFYTLLLLAQFARHTWNVDNFEAGFISVLILTRPHLYICPWNFSHREVTLRRTIDYLRF